MNFPFARAAVSPLDLPSQYEDLRGAAPVTRVVTPTGDLAWLVTRYDDIRFAFSDLRFSSDMTHPGYPRFYVPGERQPGAFVAMDPPEHTRYRRTIASWFTSRAAEKLRSRIQEMVDGLVDDLLTGPRPVDLIANFSSLLPAAVICDFLGVPFPDRDRFGKWILTLIERDATAEQQTKAFGNLFEYMYALVAAKEAEPTDDLLGQLAGVQIRQGELTRQEVVVIGLMLLAAGFDTTASSIALGVLSLLENPSQLDRLRNDPSLIQSAVEEIFRYQNTLQFGIGRVAVEDVELGGRLIRAGEGVILLTPSGGRDEKAYARPDELDIGRQGLDPMTFGHGIHNCVGKFLARVELQVAIGTLVRRIPGLRLAVPAAELPYRDNSLVFSPRELPVTW
ncbi:cytochrome P450 [Streptosporangium sp. NPDC051023]|uniref:cytochrome P450 n=1 Tax=Streptosporangium sp. NPDC051023 TaxID=3155410 RepID=UPI00344DF378